MTILTDAPRAHNYTGDGVTTAFPYQFLVFAASDLVVTQDATTLVLNTHYTVSGVGQFTGGSVTLVIPPAAGVAVTIRSDVPITQGTKFPEGFKFPGSTVEASLDRLTIIARQLEDLIAANVPAFALPTPVANQHLGWNTDGTALVNVTAGTAGPTGPIGPPGAGAAPTITDGTTSVTLPTQLTFPPGSVSSAGAGLATIAFAVPAGVIVASAAATTPTGWLPCDGAAVNRTTFAALFSAIGIAFGAGNGTTTFNVPDLRGRFPLGAGVGAGLTARSLAATGGEQAHTLTLGELPAHAHGLTDPGHNHGGSGGGAHSHSIPTFSGGGAEGIFYTQNAGPAINTAQTGTSSASFAIAAGPTGVTVQNAGGAGAHATMPPFTVLGYIVKT